MVAHVAPVSALAVTSSGGDLVTGGAVGDGELKHFRWAPVAGVDQEYAKGEAKHKGGSYVRVRSRASARTTTTSRILRAWRRWSSPPTNGSRTRGRRRGGCGATVVARRRRAEAPHPRTAQGRRHRDGACSGRPHPGRRGAERGGPRGGRREGCEASHRRRRRVCGSVGGGRERRRGGATLAAQNAQRANAYVATEFQRKQERLAAREPELRRADMAVKARKAMPALNAPSSPWTRKLASRRTSRI